MAFQKIESFQIDLFIKSRILSKTPLTSFFSFPSGKNASAKFINSFKVALGGVFPNISSAVAALNIALRVGSILFRCQDSFNDLLLSIGADVPFCFYGKTALVQGIGEKIKFLDYDLKEYYILLVNPGIEISTNEIFQSLKITNSGSKKMSVISKKLDINYFQKRDNDLEKEVVKKYRIVGEILSNLSSYKETLISRMTGSGATCFALFNDLDDLKKIESKIKREYKNVWVKASKLINSIEDI